MSFGKVIVISRSGSDFSMDLIWAGLVRRLGSDRVIDYPVRSKHRERPTLVGDHELDYGAERRSLCYVEGATCPERSLQQILLMIARREISHIFLDETDESRDLYRDLQSKFPLNLQPSVVIIAGHDRFRGDPKATLDRYEYYSGMKVAGMFVDDWQPGYYVLPKTHLINLSSNFDHLWEHTRRAEYLADKAYDICFVGYNSHPIRKIVIDHIKNRWSHLTNHIMLEERPNEFSAFTRHDVYFRDIARSRICINLPGASAGGRALRFYEIPYVGSYMLSMTFDARLLDPPIDSIHCGFFSALDELDSKIEHALEMPQEREMIAAAGHAHFVQKHSVDARIEYVLGKLGDS